MSFRFLPINAGGVETRGDIPWFDGGGTVVIIIVPGAIMPDAPIVRLLLPGAVVVITWWKIVLVVICVVLFLVYVMVEAVETGHVNIAEIFIAEANANRNTEEMEVILGVVRRTKMENLPNLRMDVLSVQTV